MDSAHFRRQTVALVAAYAVVLQALLSGLVPAVPLAASFTIICSHDGDGGTGQPVQHEPPCAAICAALGHGISGSLPPAVNIVAAAGYILAAPAPAGDWVEPQPAARSPRFPRGPPLA